MTISGILAFLLMLIAKGLGTLAFAIILGWGIQLANGPLRIV